MSIKQCERIGWPTILGLGLVVGALARSFQYRERTSFGLQHESLYLKSPSNPCRCE